MNMDTVSRNDSLSVATKSLVDKFIPTKNNSLIFHSVAAGVVSRRLSGRVHAFGFGGVI